MTDRRRVISVDEMYDMTREFLSEGRHVESESATLLNSIPHLYGLSQNVENDEIRKLATKLLKLVKSIVEE